MSMERKDGRRDVLKKIGVVGAATTGLLAGGSGSVAASDPVARWELSADPDTLDVGDTLEMDGSNSGGTGIDYQWTLELYGEVIGPEIDWQEPVTSHRFDEPGVYRLDLTVRRGNDWDNIDTKFTVGDGINIVQYANDDRRIDRDGLDDAIDDWFNNEIDTETLNVVVDAYEAGGRVY